MVQGSQGFSQISGTDGSNNPFPLFENPSAEFKGIRWGGFDLSNLTDSNAVRAMRAGAESKMWGSTLLGPGGGPTTGLSEAYLKASRRTPSDKGVTYLSEEYFRIYKLAIEEGIKYNFPVSTLYDEWNYPSGIVGGQFYSKYPEDAAKSIEIAEKNVTGPGKAELEIPTGIYVGAVMMNLDTYERIDVSKNLSGNNIIQCKIPKGKWKLMGFYLDSDFRPASQKGGFVDYLSKEAVARYIAMNFDPYYAHLKEYFGTVIKRTIYDEPAMHLSDGRMWTPGFNAEFEKKYHYSPLIYYPALWYDIGPETSAARNALFGFRAELFAENYIGQMAEWCASHGIKLSGLISTAADYARFAQMLLNKGELEGKRILSRKTIELMTSNSIGDLYIFNPFKHNGIMGDKFGYGFGIRTERGVYDELESIWTFGWDGIFLSQVDNYWSETLIGKFRNLVYQSISE